MVLKAQHHDVDDDAPLRPTQHPNDDRHHTHGVTESRSSTPCRTETNTSKPLWLRTTAAAERAAVSHCGERRGLPATSPRPRLATRRCSYGRRRTRPLLPCCCLDCRRRTDTQSVTQRPLNQKAGTQRIRTSSRRGSSHGVTKAAKKRVSRHCSHDTRVGVTPMSTQLQRGHTHTRTHTRGHTHTHKHTGTHTHTHTRTHTHNPHAGTLDRAQHVLLP
jgi:hypothetical protein